MGMNIGNGGDDEVMVEMNTTPLIDVMLVLIVMLIITLPIQTHAVKMDMPVTNAPPPTELPTVINIEVDFDGTMRWDGSVIRDGEMLKNYMLHAANMEPKPEVHLKPHKLAKYDVVAKVLATAQRLGLTNIGIVGNEKLE
ncbi:biopolymer transporter ExbD [Cellvibrio mixtus]|jgi:biopolymer transport protein ExbD|uniref:Biopolymer transporter ExbD n=1 Tax=Cellvibrio mixtus TaxID=39650 RepID=A0A266Q6R1_9GAMM|nr:biopolymer transporter ExbD [Cellvibrio mixtus]OZY85532.1 biopolymer transporter ExbD [Cellvibrio mixtus]